MEIPVLKGEIIMPTKKSKGPKGKKKCKERELLKLAYWKINRPK
jgi:hypothetical protein